MDELLTFFYNWIRAKFISNSFKILPCFFSSYFHEEGNPKWIGIWVNNLLLKCILNNFNINCDKGRETKAPNNVWIFKFWKQFIFYLALLRCELRFHEQIFFNDIKSRCVAIRNIPKIPKKRYIRSLGTWHIHTPKEYTSWMLTIASHFQCISYFSTDEKEIFSTLAPY